MHPNTERNQGDRQEQTYPRTDRPGAERPATDREQTYPHEQQDLHYQSPTKHDMDYYQRKVNRLQNELGNVEEELSLTKFKLQKAEDFERKFEELFRQNQDLNDQLNETKDLHIQKSRQASELRGKLDEALFNISKLESDFQGHKLSAEQITKKKQQDNKKVSNQGAQERAQVERSYLRQIDNLRAQSRARQDKLKKEVTELQFLVASKENSESALKTKLDHIKKEKNQEINRLKDNMNDLKTELSQNNQKNDQRVINHRTQLIEETQSRLSNVRSLTLDIENTLIEQIKNLNEIVAKKDAQISFLLQADKSQLQQNEETQNNLKAHIRRLQDKIFVIQRENQIELFTTVDRLKRQYEQNIDELNSNFDQIRQGHKEQVKDLNDENDGLRKQVQAITRQAKNWEDQHKRLSADKELNEKMLSQKIISLEKLKDDDLKNYTTSMRNIQDDAKHKIEDLHAAVQSKNNQFEIMTSQINLKNEEINTLLEDIQKLRGQNRQKIRQLETTNALQQNSLNELITTYKKQIMELKRRVHQLQAEMSDSISQYKLKNDLLRQDLNNQKETNELLRGRNQFLTAWCKELEGDLKKERISNVDVLHDHTVSRRQTVQIRERVKVELEAIKDREVEQISNVFKLQKGRLESDLSKREQQLNHLRAENNRLLSEYKNLERKVGKPSKLEKGSEQQGKCRATLEAQILLTENIFNAINRP